MPVPPTVVAFQTQRTGWRVLLEMAAQVAGPVGEATSPSRKSRPVVRLHRRRTASVPVLPTVNAIHVLFNSPASRQPVWAGPVQGGAPNRRVAHGAGCGHLVHVAEAAGRDLEGEGVAGASGDGAITSRGQTTASSTWAGSGNDSPPPGPPPPDPNSYLHQWRYSLFACFRKATYRYRQWHRSRPSS